MTFYFKQLLILNSLRTETGYLYAIGPKCCEVKFQHEYKYCTLPVDDEIRKHDKSIVSCKFVDDQFVFIRNRSDRNHPNSLRTVKGKINMKFNKLLNHQICYKLLAKLNTLENPVSKERLVSFLETRGASRRGIL